MNQSDSLNLITVREATEADLPVYMELSADFHAASPMQKVCEFDPKGFEAFVRLAMQNPDICILLAEVNGEIVGITGGIIYPLYFSPTHKVSQELWWWLTPAARGSGAGNKMFKHLQSWSKERGAKTIFMIALEDEKAQKMEKIYCRSGFEPMERTFMKEIT
jgi:GNAT superfamily N-acetyltransferase